uniref:Glycylpeptide N-tetradecanoyltransferase n=1 Tax=Diacronema lutheri TaxID=2081491 RepID=A0A7R9UK75_DIALT|mmetsp:Transcript_1391/g.4567  ORF Transcript_1391/g.4567 Transcript_1391/m.4567 type:complete len:454 (+) Transcript_1391:586-1947(+)
MADARGSAPAAAPAAGSEAGASGGKGRLAEASGMEDAESKFQVSKLKHAVEEAEAACSGPGSGGVADDHAFWYSQPVPRMTDPELGPDEPRGPIVPSDISTVPKEALKLPAGFEWSSVRLDDDSELSELYTLLKENYVEDSQAMFRFEYSKPFIQWAMMPPGYKLEWHVGVRVSSSRKLVAFIGATPAEIVIHGDRLSACEVNFLCVHKKLRTKRLAPVLIREVTRRCNLAGVFQAAYTAGVVIPKPVGFCQYWHRSLNPKKLIDVGFSSLGPRNTMSRLIKMLKLPDEPLTRGFRPLRPADVPVCCAMLNEHLKRFKYYQVFDEAEFAHWLLPREGVVFSYVVEGEGGALTDMASFYNLPSSIIGNEKYPTLHAAYSYYTVAKKTSLDALMKDAMIEACRHNFDVFNALDLQDNASVLSNLKFGPGDGKLQYYAYNWKCQKIAANEVGLILL